MKRIEEKGVETRMARAILVLKKRRGSAQLIQAAMSIMILIAIGAVIVSMTVGIGSQITQNFPQPTPNSLFDNLTKVFNTSVNQGASLLPAVFLVGFGVIVLGAVLYIWAWFSPRPVGR